MSFKIALLEGDGIGPEISQAVVKIFSAAKIPVEWVKIPCGDETLAKENSAMPLSAIQKVKELKVALKGPTGTPIGKGHQSANVTLRKSLDLYANFRPVQSLPGVKTRFDGIDVLIVRENTEDLYASIEHQVAPGVMQGLKIITQPGCERIIRFAFEMAKKLNRKKVTCVHKANIMKLTDGMFLEIFRSIAKEYLQFESQDMIVDNTCMQLVTRPEQFDVIVTENLYGDILSDLSAGLIGGLGVAGGANIGKEVAVFEAVHGTAPDIAGKNLCNPTALLLSATMMLDYMELRKEADRIRQGLFKVLKEGKATTRDLKGTATCSEFTSAVIAAL